MILARAIAEAIDEGLYVPEHVTCAEWVTRFGATIKGATPGPFEVARVPYTSEILNAFDEPNVKQITLIKGSQVGITELSVQMLGFAIDRKPGTTMFVYPTRDTAAEMNRDRVTPTLAAMPPIRDAQLKETRKEGSMRVVRYRTMSVFYRGAGTDRQLESLPCRYVFGDEIDRCPPGTVHLVRQRLKTFPDGKLVVLGKPGLEGVGIDAEWQASDQRRYHVPCPLCGGWHTRVFSRVRWYGRQRDGTDGPDSRDTTVDATQAAETAAFKCPTCHGLIEALHNAWQLSRGLWVRRGAAVTGDGREGPGRIVWPDGVEPPASSNRGYHVPEPLSGLLANPYAPSAEAFVRRRGIIDQEFAADHEGRAWRLNLGGKADIAALRSRVDPGHRRGYVPSEAVVLVAFADIQDHYAYITVQAYSAKMAKRWTVWYERVPAEFGKGLGTLDDVFYRTWPTIDGRSMQIMARGVDSGDGDRQLEIYRYCSSREQCWATKGVGVDRSARLMAEPHTLKRLSRATIAGAKSDVHLLRINTHVFKTRIQRALGIALPDDGVKPVADDDQDVLADDMARARDANNNTFILPADVEDHYLHQLAAEECVRETSSKRGGLVTEYRWRLREGHPANHYFDCVVGCEALAHARGCEKLERPAGIVAIAKEPTPPKPVQPRPTSMLDLARQNRVRR